MATPRSMTTRAPGGAPAPRACRPACAVRGRCRRRPWNGARSRWRRASGPGSAADSRCASPSSARALPALLARLALEVGVGQVVEGHRRLAVEQPHRAVEQMRLDRLAMLHQRVRGAVELHRADGREVDAEQLAEAAARLQPAVRRALRGGLGETPDNDAGRRRAQGAVDANSASRAGRPIAPAPTGRVARPRRCGDGPDAASRTSTRCTSVGSAAVPSRGAPRASNCAAMRCASCSTAGGPSAIRGAWPVKMSSMRAHNGGHWAWGMSKWRPRLSRVRCRTVSSDALGVHEAMGEVGFSVLGPPGLGAPNEHATHVSGRGGRSQPIIYDYGTTSVPSKPVPLESTLTDMQSRNTAKIGKMAGQLGKLGLAARGGTPRCTEIGAAPAWQGATREQIGAFVTEEQRRHAGCSADRMQWAFTTGC